MPFAGRRDLEKRLLRRLSSYRKRSDCRFLVLVDYNDGRDCTQTKRDLLALCRPLTTDRTLVRLVCQELEGWYFGDPDALGNLYPDLPLKDATIRNFIRNPDEVPKPSHQLRDRLPGFNKQAAAAFMDATLDPDRVAAASSSFRQFRAAVDRLW